MKKKKKQIRLMKIKKKLLRGAKQENQKKTAS
jgi:hypothetical protein